MALTERTKRNSFTVASLLPHFFSAVHVRRALCSAVGQIHLYSHLDVIYASVACDTSTDPACERKRKKSTSRHGPKDYFTRRRESVGSVAEVKYQCIIVSKFQSFFDTLTHDALTLNYERRITR